MALSSISMASWSTRTVFTREVRSKELNLRFLAGSTLKSRASWAAKLPRQGFEAYDEEVITASFATAEYLRGIVQIDENQGK